MGRKYFAEFTSSYQGRCFSKAGEFTRTFSIDQPAGLYLLGMNIGE